MAEERNTPPHTPIDPLEPWKKMRDAYLDAWSKTMIDTVNSEAYAQASGAALANYLTVASPFREAVEKTMLKMLEQLSMPSRNDVISIAERITNLEMKIDDIDAKLDTLLGASKGDTEATSETHAASHNGGATSKKKSAAKD